MLRHLFVTALRNLQKTKFYSIINISGLAVGMAVFMTLALWIKDELDFNTGVPNYERIAQVVQNQTFNGEVQTWNTVPLPLADVLRNTYGNHFSQVVTSAYQTKRMLSVGEKRLAVPGNYMDSGITNMLSLHMLKGSRNGLQSLNSILLSESAAKALFGDEDPLNKVIKLEDKADVAVTGVYADLPANSAFGELQFISPFQLMVATEHLNDALKNPWGASWFRIYVAVKDKNDMATASAAIKDAKTNHVPRDQAVNKPEILLHPMVNWHLRDEFKNGHPAGGRILYVWLFGIIGAFVLLLASINFMNLSTARSEKRAKEVGIRKAIGSRKRQLVNQFFMESILVALSAFLVSVVLLQLMLPFFNSIAAKDITVPWTNAWYWLLGILFSVAVGLLAGIYPAVYLSSFNPVKVLKGIGGDGRSTLIPRRVMVVTQFTVSIILMVGTIAVFRQINFAKDRPVGYNKNRVVTFYTAGISEHFAAFRNDLLQSGKVSEVAQSETELTSTYITNSGFNWRGKDPALQEEFVTLGITPAFGKTVGWQIIAGRDFSGEFPTDSSGIIINEAAAAYLGFKNPVGEILQWGKDGQVHIIGVVKNMITQSPYDPFKQTFFYLRRGALNVSNVKVNAGVSMAGALAVFKDIVHKYNPKQVFEYHFMDEQYAQHFENEVRTGKLAAFFSILAVFISCLGVFGMAAYTAEQRTKEIGVRKVLGASVADVWRLLSKEFVWMVGISSAIAIPLAWYLMRNWLQHYEYRAALSWWIFAAAAAGALLVTILTVSFQSIKAALANPVQSLRTE